MQVHPALPTVENAAMQRSIPHAARPNRFDQDATAGISRVPDPCRSLLQQPIAPLQIILSTKPGGSIVNSTKIEVPFRHPFCYFEMSTRRDDSWRRKHELNLPTVCFRKQARRTTQRSSSPDIDRWPTGSAIRASSRNPTAASARFLLSDTASP